MSDHLDDVFKYAAARRKEGPLGSLPVFKSFSTKIIGDKWEAEGTIDLPKSLLKLDKEREKFMSEKILHNLIDHWEMPGYEDEIDLNNPKNYGGLSLRTSESPIFTEWFYQLDKDTVDNAILIIRKTLLQCLREMISGEYTHESFYGLPSLQDYWNYSNPRQLERAEYDNRLQKRYLEKQTNEIYELKKQVQDALNQLQVLRTESDALKKVLQKVTLRANTLCYGTQRSVL